VTSGARDAARRALLWLIKSDAGRRSDFTIAYPGAAMMAGERISALMATAELDHETLEAAPKLTRLKVLVIDDHEINRMAVGMILKPTGAQVTCANPAEALELLARRPFDAIVTDGAMPGYPGRGARRLLGDLAGPNPSVPVVSISGRGEPEAPDVSLAAGVRLTIGRRIDPAALCAALGALMGRDEDVAAVA